MQHTNAWLGHCSIPLLIGQIWLPNSAVFNFVRIKQWLKILNSTWCSPWTVFSLGLTRQDFLLMWPRDPKRIVRDKKTETWGISKTGQSERRHDERVKFFGAGLVNSYHKPSHPLHWGFFLRKVWLLAIKISLVPTTFIELQLTRKLLFWTCSPRWSVKKR